MSEQAPEPFDHFALVELMGHTTLAGRVTEATIGGSSFVRLDVPPVQGRQGFTKLLGAGAIYSLTIVEEAVALAALERLRPVPVSVYLLPAPKAQAYDMQDDEYGEDDDEDD